MFYGLPFYIKIKKKDIINNDILFDNLGNRPMIKLQGLSLKRTITVNLSCYI